MHHSKFGSPIGRLGVKMRKSQREHLSTAVSQQADVVLNAANGSYVPLGDILGSRNRKRAPHGRAIQQFDTEHTRASGAVGQPRDRNEQDRAQRQTNHAEGGEQDDLPAL